MPDFFSCEEIIGSITEEAAKELREQRQRQVGG
jgi:hypothetical protein